MALFILGAAIATGLYAVIEDTINYYNERSKQKN